MASNKASVRAAHAIMARRARMVGLSLLGCISLVLAADSTAGLSDDFLEYLGSLEGDDENWQDFTAETVASRAPVTRPGTTAPPPQTSPTASASSSAANPDARTSIGVNTHAASKTGKADK